MSAIPYLSLLGRAVAWLGLAPADFWAMTPRELSAAFKARFGEAPAAPPRAALERLMRRYPDEGASHA